MTAFTAVTAVQMRGGAMTRPPMTNDQPLSPSAIRMRRLRERRRKGWTRVIAVEVIRAFANTF